MANNLLTYEEMSSATTANRMAVRACNNFYEEFAGIAGCELLRSLSKLRNKHFVIVLDATEPTVAAIPQFQAAYLPQLQLVQQLSMQNAPQALLVFMWRHTNLNMGMWLPPAAESSTWPFPADVVHLD